MEKLIRHRIVTLLFKHLEGTLNAAEKSELDHLAALYPSVSSTIEKLKTDEGFEQLIQIWHTDPVRAWKRITQQVPELQAAEKENRPGVFRLKTFGWYKLVAAAVGIGLIFTTYWLWPDQKSPQQRAVATKEDSFKNDIDPGVYKAKLTLGNGQELILDSAASGVLAQQGNAVVENRNGQLVYNSKGATADILYNTLSTTRGQTYSTQLSDGSKVWLNSASRLHFPTTFNGKQRRVEVMGEAYFEIAKDKTKPFIVSIVSPSDKLQKTEIEVLGTRFNVNAYEDENEINTSLLEGSIRLTTNSDVKAPNSKLLTPGQLATVNNTGVIKVTSDFDVESSVAWMKGIFQFDKADVSKVMRQLARWYNVDVVYDGPVPTVSYEGGIDKNIPLSKVLANLEKLGEVHFQIEGRTIKVIK